MRTLRFRPTFSLPTCIHRKVSDERSRRALEVGEFPLQVLESRRKERLAELKAECLDLKNQLSEQSLQAALLREVQQENGSMQNLLPDHSKPMNGGSGIEVGSVSGSSNAIPPYFEENLRKQREERLLILRRELEEFAIKYSLGEFAEKIDGIGISMSPLRKSKSAEWGDLKISGGQFPSQQQIDADGPSQVQGVNSNAANAGILLRIQRQREQELQRARMELRHLAFRLKHKLEEKN